jgi:hypothetical protein
LPPQSFFWREFGSAYLSETIIRTDHNPDVALALCDTRRCGLHLGSSFVS